MPANETVKEAMRKNRDSADGNMDERTAGVMLGEGFIDINGVKLDVK
jgi:hypothetical protein